MLSSMDFVLKISLQGNGFRYSIAYIGVILLCYYSAPFPFVLPILPDPLLLLSCFSPDNPHFCFHLTCISLPFLLPAPRLLPHLSQSSFHPTPPHTPDLNPKPTYERRVWSLSPLILSLFTHHSDLQLHPFCANSVT